ncbi:MAG: threonine--tRNA ligase [Gammaproteobacteria bacterium]
MPIITLPDGSTRQFEQPLTVAELANSIAKSLGQAALAGKVDGKLVDTSYLLEHDANVAVITAKDANGLEVLRHSSAHLLAHAVKRLYPEAQVTIGPVVEDGFFYDFSYPQHHFTPEDLVAIENKMREIVQADYPVHRELMPRDEAVKLFKAMGENYKAEIIASIPANEDISLYRQEDFVDLCRGPHVPSTGKLKAFKLTKLAGAYWRGDHNNEMLQRVYGTAWATPADLETYLHRIAEAEKRDHRKLGKALDLFHLQEEAPGMVFWHPKGWIIWQVIEQYIRVFQKQHGYLEIRTPQLLDRSLWERSGHWEKFHEHMFTTSSENREYAVKPMSCPCHIQVFNQGLKSYRDLPLRLAEFGCCHRNETSGSLHGLMRVRSMVQDDGHIFCTPEQIYAEASAFIDQVYQVYAEFGFDKIEIKVSTRPEKRVGSDEVWDKAEKYLMQALDDKSLPWDLNPGEGAFYGPKIEFSLRDSLHRLWQCGTLQLDFSLPERLGASYIAEDGNPKIPVMLHRAVLGTLERFIGILIEDYAGALPLWLAPVQVAVLTITDGQAEYAKQVADELTVAGFRVEADLRNEKIGFKIREHTLQKAPYLVVLGDREKESGQIAVRKRDGTDLGNCTVADFIENLRQENAKLGRR